MCLQFNFGHSIGQELIMFIIKVGGSSLTEKTQLETLNESAVQHFVSDIKGLWEKSTRFVVVHGAGSFGHLHAKKFLVNDGFHNAEKPDQVQIGFAKTRVSVTKLNSILLERLNDVGVPAVNIPVFPVWETAGGAVTRCDCEAVSAALRAGLLPVLHGDCVLDSARGCTILSGDTVVQTLAEHFSPPRVLFLTNVAGVYSEAPGSPDGHIEKFVNTKFERMTADGLMTLTKLEGQMWLAMYQLLMSEDCQRKYAFDPHRKACILQIRGRLTEVILDQLPVLGDLRRYLEELSVMDPPPPASQLVIEQMPEIKEAILRDNKGKWKKIAREQSRTYFDPSSVNVRAHAQRLADTYSLDMLENLTIDPPKCAVCGAQAAKRCSRCQNEWYCRRECQVGHWKKHKPACDLLTDALQKVKDEQK